MLRRWMTLLIAILALATLVAAACGDDDEPADAATPASGETATAGGDASGSPTAPIDPTPRQSRPLPTPTPVGDDGIAIQVVAGETRYTPTLAELRLLPTTEVDAGGTRTGISLATLASQVGASEGVVTIQGLQADLGRIGLIRYPLAEVGETTVFVVNDRGHLDLYSSSIPEGEWLRAVSAVSIN